MSTEHVAGPVDKAGEALCHVDDEAGERIGEIRKALSTISDKRKRAGRGYRIFRQRLTDQEDSLHEELSQLTGEDMPMPEPTESDDGDCEERLQGARARMAEVERELDGVITERDDLQRQLSQADADKQRLTHEAGEALRRVDEYHQSGSSAELVQLQSQLAEVTRERDRLTRDKETLASELARLRTENSDLNASVASLRDERRSHLEDINSLETANRELRDGLASTPRHGNPPVRRTSSPDPRTWDKWQRVLAVLGLIVGVIVASFTWHPLFGDINGAGRGVASTFWWIILAGFGFFSFGWAGTYVKGAFRAACNWWRNHRPVDEA